MDKEEMRKAFEEVVTRDLGDVPVVDQGRYVSPKIQKYWLVWQAAMAHSCADKDAIAEALRRVLRSFPPASDMLDMGWESCEIEEACSAREQAFAALSRHGG